MQIRRTKCQEVNGQRENSVCVDGHCKKGPIPSLSLLLSWQNDLLFKGIWLGWSTILLPSPLWFTTLHTNLIRLRARYASPSLEFNLHVCMRERERRERYLRAQRNVFAGSGNHHKNRTDQERERGNANLSVARIREIGFDFFAAFDRISIPSSWFRFLPFPR